VDGDGRLDHGLARCDGFKTGKSKSNYEIQGSFPSLKSGFTVGVEEGNRRFPSGMTNKGTADSTPTATSLKDDGEEQTTARALNR
jgi:hypothetical protein